MSLLSNQSVSAGRILVVDDDQGARDLMVSSLRAAGHDMDPTSNGPEPRPELDGPSLYSALTGGRPDLRTSSSCLRSPTPLSSRHVCWRSRSRSGLCAGQSG